LVVLWDTRPRVFTFKAQSVFILPSQRQCDRTSTSVLDTVSREEQGVSTMPV
jgi:hypothetical protein